MPLAVLARAYYSQRSTGHEHVTTRRRQVRPSSRRLQPFELNNNEQGEQQIELVKAGQRSEQDSIISLPNIHAHLFITIQPYSPFNTLAFHVPG